MTLFSLPFLLYLFYLSLLFFVNRSWYLTLFAVIFTSRLTSFVILSKHLLYQDVLFSTKITVIWWWTWNHKQKMMHKINQKTSKSWQTIMSKQDKYHSSKIKSQASWVKQFTCRWLMMYVTFLWYTCHINDVRCDTEHITLSAWFSCIIQKIWSKLWKWVYAKTTEKSNMPPKKYVWFVSTEKITKITNWKHESYEVKFKIDKTGESLQNFKKHLFESRE